MKIEVLPESLLMGPVLRCQPTEDGPVSIAPIDGRCHYRRGDSQGEYQIIGPGMHKKLDRNW
mgnify:CR=1 FL=1